MPARTFDKPLDFMVAQNASDIATLTARVDALDPELQTALFSDVAFSIVAAAWTEDTTNNVWTYTWNNALILADSGIFVIYDGSYRTALVGDINAHKNTGSVVFTTTKEPVGTLSGVIRIISSTAGVQTVAGGGTGAATPKGARENLNTPIRDIPVNLTAISSLPYTYYDADIRANMKGFDFSFSNPSALPSGIDLTFADPSGNLGGSVTITGTISGETDIHFWCHEERTAPEGTETVQSTQRVQDFVQTNEQSLTAAQKAQVLQNIGAQDKFDEMTMTLPGTPVDIKSYNSSKNTYIVPCDGYGNLEVLTNTWATIYWKGSDVPLISCKSFTSGENARSNVYLRKGMEIYTGYASASSVVIKFIPFVSSAS